MSKQNQGKIPNNEKIVVRYFCENGNELFALTKLSNNQYHLYEKKGSVYAKLGKGKNPLELESKFGVSEKLR